MKVAHSRHSGVGARCCRAGDGGAVVAMDA